MGTANAWAYGVPEPLEMIAHDQAVAAGEKHNVETVAIGRGVNLSTCTTCGISWSIDSSD
jgi:hypothetical protein